jgi:hypothetical protein
MSRRIRWLTVAYALALSAGAAANIRINYVAKGST